MKKHKFNVVDIVVIIVLLGLIAGAIFKFTVVNKQSQTATQSMENRDYVVLVKGVRQPTIDGIHQDDKFFDSKTGIFMGKVKEINAEPYLTMMLTDDNEYKRVEKIGYFNLYLTLEAPILEREKGYFVEGKVELKRNSSLNIYSKFVKTGFRVLDIK